jgi:hypothetical protein
MIEGELYRPGQHPRKRTFTWRAAQESRRADGRSERPPALVGSLPAGHSGDLESLKLPFVA